MSVGTERLSAPDPGAEGTDQTGQYLTFRLADEIYGVDILKVQEIRSWDCVTPLPNTCKAVLGVLNLRGTIIPIVDLRRHFDLPEGETGPTTVIVVVKVRQPRERVMGLLVDAVSDVHTLGEEHLRSAPAVGHLAEQNLVGLAEVDGTMITLLDIDALLNSGDLSPEPVGTA